MEKIEKYKNILILLILTIFAFQYGLGFEKFNPANISWLFEARADWATHYLGWCFYRDEPWQFPLGTIDRYYYPIGTNIGFTDSIPLVAIPLKLISFLLPDNFQYFGMWLFLCMFLNGYYSLKIFQHFNINKVVAYLLVIIILLNPVFIFRQIHPSYCAHWLLIGSIYLYLTTEKNCKNLRKRIIHHLILIFLSSLITVYLSIAVLGFFGLFLFKLFFYDKLIVLKSAIIYFSTALITLFGSWILVGLIDFSKHTNIASKGFYGIYKMNLNALYNPLGYSKTISSQPLVSGYQQDSFMYLGLGVIFIIILSLIYSIKSYLKNKKIFFNKKLIPLLIFSFLLSVFAATNVISLNDKNIFTIPFLEKMVYLGDIFRASGRFFWSVYYLMIFYFIFIFTKIPLSKYVKIGVVSLLVVIQLFDTSPVFAKKTAQLGDYKPPMNIKYWNSIFSNFKNIITVMPFNNDLVSFQDYQEIAYFTYKNGGNVTNGNLARYDGNESQLYINKITNEIIKGEFPLENLYVSNKENLKYFSIAYKKGLINITNSDGYYFVYSSKKAMKNLALNTIKDKLDLEKAKKENLKPVEFEIYNRPLKPSSGEVKLNFENELITDLICQLKGWAFIEKSNNNIGDSIFIYLKNDKHIYLKKCVQSERKDITIVFKKENLDNSGFECFTLLNNLEKGKYELLVAIKDKKGDVYYSKNDKIINIGYKDINDPIKTENKLTQNQNINFGVDVFDFLKNELKIKGWAAYKEFDSKKSTIEILLIHDNDYYNVETISNIRTDVTAFLNNKFNYDDSGFETKISTKSLPKGDYFIGIRIVNKLYNKDSYILTDKKITVN